MTDFQAKHVTLHAYIPAVISEVELWQDEVRSVKTSLEIFRGSALDRFLLQYRLDYALKQINDLTGFND